MEKNGHDKITAFDTLFTTNHIQMLKILMPYFEPHMRRQLAVYIKYLELRYALSYFDSASHELYGCAGGYGSFHDGDPFGREEFNIGKICSEILPYCTNEEKQKVEQISGLFRSMEMYKEMSQTFEMMKEFMPDFSPDFLSNLMPDSPADGKPGASPDSRAEGSGNGNGNPEPGTGKEDTENENGNTNQGSNMMDMLMNMLSPEQKAMFEMFGGNHTHDSK